MGKPHSVVRRLGGPASGYEVLSARGVVFKDEPHLIAHMQDHDLWMALFRDVDRTCWRS